LYSTVQKNTADFVAEKLHAAIFGTQEFQDGKPEDSLSIGFHQVDKEVVELANREGWMNGTTAVVAMVLDGTLYVANVGDAEACLVSVEYVKCKTIN
jgi:serine/threonine protein phosphatase PrpC